MKHKMTPAELERAKQLAERMKGHSKIENPHALARAMIKKRRPPQPPKPPHGRGY